MFTHRCLCLRDFYSKKDHCYQWLTKHRIQILCELNPGLWLAAGVWAVPSKCWELGLLRGWAAPSWCSRVPKWNWLVPLPASFTPLGTPRKTHGCPSPVGLGAWHWPPQTTATREPASAMVLTSSRGRSHLPHLQALVKHPQFWRKMESGEEEDTTEP